MASSRLGFWGCVATLLLSGCAHQAKALPPPGDEPYRIGREDVLDIAVWRDADLSRTLPVRPDGYISMPIIGELKAEDKTPVQLANDIRQALLPIVQDPRVTVIVREVNSTRIFVTGEVARPGSYPIRGRMSLLQAVALAGGFSEFADRDGIVVIRSGKEGGRYPVRFTELVSGETPEAYLRAGDTVVVP